jgi:small conductance mechanosensitive channel
VAQPTPRTRLSGVRRPRPARRRLRADARRAGRRLDARAYKASAQQHLRRFRQGSALAVALTALLLLAWGAPVAVEGQEPAPGASPAAAPAGPADPSAAVGEAATTIRDLVYGFSAFLPRLVLALVLLAVAWIAARAAGWALARALGAWQRTAAVIAIARLAIFLVAAVAALSILAGDVRAVVGSVGLLGLAASWALQTPIESFTGWLLNSFRGYYRVGDRIAVGDVFGDVYRIDLLTTTVWEAGGPGKPVAAAQATGALITFPNWEVLRSNIVNYSRDFPYVWDEITLTVANESDLGYAAGVLEAMTRRVLGDQMEEAAQRYDELLRAERLTFDVEELPRVYLSAADSWTNCTIRYLVPVRARRAWASMLVLEASRELAKPEHAGRIKPVYPRTEVRVRGRWDADDDAPAEA